MVGDRAHTRQPWRIRGFFGSCGGVAVDLIRMDRIIEIEQVIRGCMPSSYVDGPQKHPGRHHWLVE